MTSILHISYDIGDGGTSEKTNAVTNLINQTKRISDVIVVDITRVGSISKEMTVSGNNYLKINSFGLPYGVFHKYHLNRTYKKIRAAENEGDFDTSGIELIHAHKLTFDGYIGYRLSIDKQVPLIITLRQTDFMILKIRPDLRILYKNILKHCTRIIYLIPAMVTLIKEILGKEFFENYVNKKLIYIPNIISSSVDFKINDVDEDAPLITILRLTKRSVARKNLKNLFKAAAQLKEVNFRLTVIGGGDYLDTVKRWAEQYGLQNKIFFTGPVKHSEINKYYSEAKAFVLPSFSESFGLVYAESLLNGTPVLYSRGVLGFDGVFENAGCAVDPYSVESIQRGISDIIKNNGFFRANIKKLKEENAFRIFSSEYAYEIYAKMCKEILPYAHEQSSGSLLSFEG